LFDFEIPLMISRHVKIGSIINASNKILFHPSNDASSVLPHLSLFTWSEYHKPRRGRENQRDFLSALFELFSKKINAFY
jgi:hypothetical protein